MTIRTHNPAFPSLAHTDYASLVTFRKDGTPVATPVWFAEHNRTIYVTTGAGTGKVKRIRCTPRVTLAPCTFSGKVTAASIECRARIVTDPGEIMLAKGALNRKYGLKQQGYRLLMKALRTLRRKQDFQFVYIAIEPVYIA